VLATKDRGSAWTEGGCEWGQGTLFSWEVQTVAFWSCHGWSGELSRGDPALPAPPPPPRHQSCATHQAQSLQAQW
jgi:hypothetical protein